MNDQEYQETQNALNLIARMISGLDLTGFLKRIDQADSIAPILDPTLYRDGAERMHAIKKLAQEAKRVQSAFIEMNEIVKNEEA